MSVVASDYILLTFSYRFTFGPLLVARSVIWNRVCLSVCPFVLPSFRPSFRLSGRFLRIASLVFSKFWHGARNPYEVVRNRARFSRKKIFAQKIDQWTKNGQKKEFFEFIEIFCFILLNLFFNDNLYYLLCCCANPILMKISVPEIWAKMFSANQIARFFNQPYLQNQSMK